MVSVVSFQVFSFMYSCGVCPQRLLIGATSGDFHTNPEDRYRQIYYEALDFVVQATSDRFDQPGYGVYQNLQELLLKACKGDRYQGQLEAVLDIYKDDLSKVALEVQLPLLKKRCLKISAGNYLKSFP